MSISGLSADFQGPVIVRYAHSPKKFYVQLVDNIPDHDVLMEKLSINCQKMGKCLSDVRPGVLCSVSVDNEGDWYRGKVVEVKSSEKKISVKLVDYGKIIDVPMSSLREIGYQFTLMPPQVYECCIKGFESVQDVTESSANAFEMLVEDAKGERKILKMHIVDFLTEETLLVNLFDDAQMPPVNISKSLCKSQMPYKDYVNMFEKKTVAPMRKRESFARNEIIATEIPFEPGANFSTSSDVESHQSREETVMWENGNSTVSDCSLEGDGGRMRQSSDRRLNPSDKRNNNFAEKLPFADNPKGSNEKDWKASSALELKTVESISLSSTDYKPPEVTTHTDTDVIFTWWIDPEEFYVHRKTHRNDYEAMMNEIQEFYGDKTTIGTTYYENGWCVVARNSRDNLLSRAKVFDYNKMLNKYKVFFVDKGYRGVATPDAMWPITETFMRLPTMAIKCSLANNVVLEFERQDIVGQISKYVNDKMAIKCRFNAIINNVHHVNVTVERGDLLVALAKDGLVEMFKNKNEEEPPLLSDYVILSMNLLVGQTIRVKILNVESLEKFQVNFEHSDIQLPATYYDIDCGKILMEKMGEQLKKLEGTYCKVHVVSLGLDDVLQLNILSRVFLEEPPLICPQAILRDTFSVCVAFVESLTVIHVQKLEFVDLLTDQIIEMYEFYESEDSFSLLLHDVALKGIYAVKSSTDGNWYRGEVLSITECGIKVKYIDYGNTEVVKMENLRFLTPNFSQASCYATRIFLTLERLEGCASDDDAKAELNNLICKITPYLHIFMPYKGNYIGKLFSNGHNVGYELKAKGVASIVSVNTICNYIDGLVAQVAGAVQL